MFKQQNNSLFFWVLQADAVFTAGPCSGKLWLVNSYLARLHEDIWTHAGLGFVHCSCSMSAEKHWARLYQVKNFGKEPPKFSEQNFNPPKFSPPKMHSSLLVVCLLLWLGMWATAQSYMHSHRQHITTNLAMTGNPLVVHGNDTRTTTTPHTTKSPQEVLTKCKRKHHMFYTDTNTNTDTRLHQ